MIEFAVLITVVVGFLLVKAVYKNGSSWLRTKDGRGILFGLFVAPLAAIVIALALSLLGGCATLNNPYIEVYAGIERTKNLSPQCEEGGADDKLTSNLGVRGCAEVSEDSNTLVCGVYRHHSCAISPDDRSYDATGITVNRRVYF